MTDLYYIAPTNKQFEEVKQKAIEIWQTYDNTYGYVDEKVNRIKDLKNIQDNVMSIIAMFDIRNQQILSLMLTDEIKKVINDRMIAGGTPQEYNPFYL